MISESDSPLARAYGDGPRFEDAIQILAEAISARAFPGCAFGVMAAGAVLLEGSLGQFTYERDAPSVTVETAFDVASLTKVIATSASAMLLTQSGLLDLETPLGTLLPEFLTGRGANDPGRRVTLRHLLAHNSGLPGHVEFFRTARNADALLAALLRLPIEAEPGTRDEYSDPGFLLLGKALERLTAEPLDLWVGREVLRPLGMAATSFNPPAAARFSIPPTEQDATLRHRRIQGEAQDENAWLLGGVAGHAGLFSNVPDMLRFAGEILAGLPGTRQGARHRRLFEPQTVGLFSRRQEPEGSSRALGWDTPSKDSSSGRHFSQRSIGHLGFSGCSLWIDLEAEVAVALLTNRTWPDRSCQLIRAVRPAFHDAVRSALERVADESPQAVKD